MLFPIFVSLIAAFHPMQRSADERCGKVFFGFTIDCQRIICKRRRREKTMSADNMDLKSIHCNLQVGDGKNLSSHLANQRKIPLMNLFCDVHLTSIQNTSSFVAELHSFIELARWEIAAFCTNSFIKSVDMLMIIIMNEQDDSNRISNLFYRHFLFSFFRFFRFFSHSNSNCCIAMLMIKHHLNGSCESIKQKNCLQCSHKHTYGKMRFLQLSACREYETFIWKERRTKWMQLLPVQTVAYFICIFSFSFRSK